MLSTLELGSSSRECCAPISRESPMAEWEWCLCTHESALIVLSLKSKEAFVGCICVGVEREGIRGDRRRVDGSQPLLVQLLLIMVHTPSPHFPTLCL